MLSFALKKYPVWFAALLLSALPAIAQADGSAATGHWDYASYTNAYGTRKYQVWVPRGYAGGQPLPLLMVLHGCLMSAAQMARLTRFDDLADTERFLVVYPSEKFHLCWDAWSPKSQSRDAGEPSILAGIVAKAKADYQVNPHRVYIAGASSGGGMASIMLACYSDLFAAGAVYSGAMYKAATDAASLRAAGSSGSIYSPEARGSEAWRCSGSPTPRLIPVLVFHGSADSVANSANGGQIVRQFLRTNDLGDDGQANHSVSDRPSSVVHAQVPGGRAYTVTTYSYHGQPLVQYYLITDMGHAYSGGSPGSPLADPKGPDASRISWQFFANYRR